MAQSVAVRDRIAAPPLCTRARRHRLAVSRVATAVRLWARTRDKDLPVAGDVVACGHAPTTQARGHGGPRRRDERDRGSGRSATAYAHRVHGRTRTPTRRHAAVGR